MDEGTGTKSARSSITFCDVKANQPAHAQVRYTKELTWCGSAQSDHTKLSCCPPKQVRIYYKLIVNFLAELSELADWLVVQNHKWMSHLRDILRICESWSEVDRKQMEHCHKQYSNNGDQMQTNRNCGNAGNGTRVSVDSQLGSVLKWSCSEDTLFKPY